LQLEDGHCERPFRASSRAARTIIRSRAEQGRKGRGQKEESKETGRQEIKPSKEPQEVGRPQDREQAAEKDYRQETCEENSEEDRALAGRRKRWSTDALSASRFLRRL
jgi:hypothetical protein